MEGYIYGEGGRGPENAPEGQAAGAVQVQPQRAAGAGRHGARRRGPPGDHEADGGVVPGGDAAGGADLSFAGEVVVCVLFVVFGGEGGWLKQLLFWLKLPVDILFTFLEPPDGIWTPLLGSM